jgi:hypothetical protein
MDSNLASAVTAFATVVLVAVTIYYAYQTRVTVKELINGRELSPMPILTCEITCDTKGGSNDAKSQIYDGKFAQIAIRNVGNAPALRTRVHVELTNSKESGAEMPTTEWSIGTVGVEQSAHRPQWKEDTVIRVPFAPTKYAKPRVMIKMEYQNVYGRNFRTTGEFHLDHLPNFSWDRQGENTVIV